MSLVGESGQSELRGAKSCGLRLASRVSPGAGDYLALMKPRVMSLVVFTALTGLVVAPGAMHPIIAVTALLCIAVGAGAAGALNMWYDADIDAVMRARARRPVPTGRVQPRRGAGLRADACRLFGGGARAAGQLCSPPRCSPSPSSSTPWSTPMWLKRSTPQNIVIGGAAGAFPPMIGWAAATGVAVVRAGAAVPDHLLLDAAAFLGAGALPRRRLCARRRADAAGGQGRRRHPRADRRSTR